MSDANVLTRGRVAAILGTSVATVRRMEGKELHPTIGPYGARTFNVAEVEAAAKLRKLRFPNHDPKVKKATMKCGTSSERLRRYALRLSEYEELLKAQEEACAICVKPFTGKTAPNVDHDHRTGRVRGLLCNNCNLMLGNARDNVIYLRRAIDYLAASEKRNTDV